MAIDRRRMLEACRQDVGALEPLLAGRAEAREVMLAVLQLSPESQALLTRILRRVNEIADRRGSEAAEAAVRRVIAILARRAGPAAH